MKTIRFEVGENKDRKYYKTGEIRDMLGVSILSVGKWIRSGQLKAVRAGGQWRVSETALDEFLSKRREEVEPPKEGKRGRGRPRLKQEPEK